MRKIGKKMLSLLLAAAAVSAQAAIPAGAEGKLSISVDYDYYGTPFVSITPAEENSVIRYTIDGSQPTFQSWRYEPGEEIQINTALLLRAAEFTQDGERLSGVKKEIKQRVSTVEISLQQETGKTTAVMTCATEGAEIRYTIDGSKPDRDSAVYAGPISVSEDTTIRARAYLDGWTNSPTVTKKAEILSPEEEEDGDDEAAEAIRYKFTYFAEKNMVYVTLIPQKNSNTIYYTTDGSQPSKKSPKYKKRVKYEEPGMLRALEYNKKGELAASLKLTVAPKASPVEFSCIDIATGTKTITMSTSAENARIYYTIDGSMPDPEYAELYEEPVTLGDKTLLKAITVKDGYKNSSVSTETVENIPLELVDFDLDEPVYSETITLLNIYRRQRGLPSLYMDLSLTEAANVRAKELSILMDHNRPSGGSYTSIFKDYGIVASSCAEYIQSYYETPEEFLNAVLSNKENENVILGKGYNFDSVGIGYYEQGKKRYWVLLLVQS